MHWIADLDLDNTPTAFEAAQLIKPPASPGVSDCAPEIGAPEGSLTVPSSDPVIDCAEATEFTSRNRTQKRGAKQGRPDSVLQASDLSSFGNRRDRMGCHSP
jgi:hypothetical protein